MHSIGSEGKTEKYIKKKQTMKPNNEQLPMVRPIVFLYV